MIDMRVTVQFGVDKNCSSLMQSLRLTQEFKENNVGFSGEGFSPALRATKLAAHEPYMESLYDCD
jgi:hypothetical protein